MKRFAHIGDHAFEIEVSSVRERLVLDVGGRKVEVVLDDQKGAIRTAYIGDRLVEFGFVRKNGMYLILIDGVEYEIELRDPRAETLAKASVAVAVQTAEVKAPIPGMIKRVLLQEGESVQRDQTVLHLDAMKLENEIASPREGTLKSVAVREGQAVEKGQLLFVVG